MKRFFNFGRNKASKDHDLGFSKELSDFSERLINKDGSFNILKKGEIIDFYHKLISLSWFNFFAIIFISFSIINGVFATIYLAIGIENLTPLKHESLLIDWLNAFHFSVYTMTTVGYGHIHPNSLISNVIASLNAMTGLLSFALITGLFYGKFSFPRAFIKYSSKAILTNEVDKENIEIRVANQSNHDLLDARVRMIFAYNQKDDKHTERIFKELKLETSNIDFLILTWKIKHLIDKNSPLYEMTLDKMKALNVEILVLISAYDDTYSQNVYSKFSYTTEDIILNAKWGNTFFTNPSGKKVFDINRIGAYKNE